MLGSYHLHTFQSHAAENSSYPSFTWFEITSHYTLTLEKSIKGEGTGLKNHFSWECLRHVCPRHLCTFHLPSVKITPSSYSHHNLELTSFSLSLICHTQALRCISKSPTLEIRSSHHQAPAQNPNQAHIRGAQAMSEPTMNKKYQNS